MVGSCLCIAGGPQRRSWICLKSIQNQVFRSCIGFQALNASWIAQSRWGAGLALGLQCCAAKGRKLAAAIPQDRILTESDGPFAKMDSRSIWPWEAAQAVVSLAEIWQVNEQAAATRLKANLKQIGES